MLRVQPDYRRSTSTRRSAQREADTSARSGERARDRLRVVACRGCAGECLRRRRLRRTAALHPRRGAPRMAACRADCADRGYIRSRAPRSRAGGDAQCPRRAPGTCASVDGDVIDDAHLLELQRCFDAAQRLDVLVGGNADLPGIAGDALHACAKALEPGRTSEGFFLSDGFDSKLAAARAEHARAQAAYEAARGRAAAAVDKRWVASFHFRIHRHAR